MPATAAEIQPVDDGTILWYVYEPAVKCELFATALTLPDDTLALIDPVPIHPDAYVDLLSNGKPSCIILTNENHARSAALLRDQLQVPIYCHPDAAPGLEIKADHLITPESLEDLSIIPIPGAPAGEIAIWQQSTASLVIGDSLIHLDGYGFTFLPDKYAPDPQQMRASLTELKQFKPQRIFFAHGFPIVNDATSRLHQLLHENALPARPQ